MTIDWDDFLFKLDDICADLATANRETDTAEKKNAILKAVNHIRDARATLACHFTKGNMG